MMNMYREKNITSRQLRRARRSLVFFLLMLTATVAFAGERLVIQLKDFTSVEIRSAGFTLPRSARLHIRALGAASENTSWQEKSALFAYGWIINADTRERVWIMQQRHTSKKEEDRLFDDEVLLPAGSYEVYFSAYAFATGNAFSNFNVNIDRRERLALKEKKKKPGFFERFIQMLGGDVTEEWERRARQWGIEVYAPPDLPAINTFTTPRNFPSPVYQAVRLGENEHIKQGFTVFQELPLRIYAIGEIAGSDQAGDYGWILDAKSRKRVWELARSGTHSAGGAAKNVKADKTVTFRPGEYVLYYVTDDSHSFLDWNQAPPDDPFHYGITLLAPPGTPADAFKLTKIPENKNVIAELIRVGDNETRQTTFSLSRESPVHIYAIGERYHSTRQMADHGWIINVKTREKVWQMEVNNTEHAGGATKNRMADETITLPKGTYTVYYQTDDSHAYNDWNSTAPFDPEHWGITVTGEGEDFSMSTVEKNVTPKATGTIAQIMSVGDDANRVESFRIEKPSKVRVYAIGEGQSGEMFDYGWIEDASGNIVWEMSYRMTFHAGGAKKNRLVNTTITLEKGKYKLRYVSDDSHSYGDWNMDPPDDPTMWGISLYEE